MALPWKILDQFITADNEIMELRQRGENDFLITIGSQILMNSKSQRSEIALGKIGCQNLSNHPRPQVLVGGLGMGITLRAVLDALPATASVVTAELNPKTLEWCLQPLAELTDNAAGDPRVTVKIADVADVIKQSAATNFDAIILDLYRGPHPQTDPRNDPIYGSRAIAHAHAALKPGGTFAIWGENPDPAFEARLAAGGFAVRCERPGKGGYRHAVWVATKTTGKKQQNSKQHRKGN
ncbi:MAG: spermidine synthase [Desulfuromonadales bacterium]|nr:spermidine synthase [Desulfuromonadales bacterium]